MTHTNESPPWFWYALCFTAASLGWVHQVVRACAVLLMYGIALTLFILEEYQAEQWTYGAGIFLTASFILTTWVWEFRNGEKFWHYRHLLNGAIIFRSIIFVVIAVIALSVYEHTNVFIIMAFASTVVIILSTLEGIVNALMFSNKIRNQVVAATN